LKFFFPDSSDHVDPSFDFVSETRSLSRVRQRDDQYAHEVLSPSPYDGILISKGIIERGMTRYTAAQRQRLLRQGAQTFFRTMVPDGGQLEVMGDCGAFSYLRERDPPYSVDEVLHFYSECRVDYGISVDHVIVQFQPSWDEQGELFSNQELEEAKRRQALTLSCAHEFWQKHQSQRLPFVPLGVAQGWSPTSYSRAVSDLQKIGFRYIAVGGLVPLKTPEILAVLNAVDSVRQHDTALHLLGVTRLERINDFSRLGVISFDSTSPLRQAFKDSTDNYHTLDGNYSAVRIPQVAANIALKRRIDSGKVSQGLAIRLERESLALIRRFDHNRASIEETLRVLREYEQLYEPEADHSEEYRRVLTDKPWRSCECAVCSTLGIHVVLFRGAERNRRRGFHNLWVFRRKLNLGLNRHVSSEKESFVTAGD
jgi:hypothetical protein